MKKWLPRIMKSTANTNTLGRFDANRIWALIGIVVLIRLVFLGLMDLLPEEAYYWNYAQHLDIGYLDHSPMVAWLIYVFQAVLGKSEFAVRLPAFLGWFAVAYFMYKLSVKLFDRAVAVRVVLLVATLPIYFSIGFIMTPDAPLYACWAGDLYYLELALVERRHRAWLGVAIFTGLGLLSKYTIGLVVLAAVVYMIYDTKARKWFYRPEPYLAAIIAGLIFLPVIIWNYQHDWVSFAFQGTRRWSGNINFSLHILLGEVLILLTPAGIIGAVLALVGKNHRQENRSLPDTLNHRHYSFVVIFTIVPLLVFIMQSLRSYTKLNWTGPVWLPIIPLIAAQMIVPSKSISSATHRFLRKLWKPTFAVLIPFYFFGLLYISLGMPGFVPSSGLPFPTAWSNFANEVKRIDKNIEKNKGINPLIVGLDKYWITSELSFYNYNRNNFMQKYGGSGLFGGNSIMWNTWLPKAAVVGKDIMLIGFSENSLKDYNVVKTFGSVSDIHREVIKKHNREVGVFFWRIGYGYGL